MKAQIATFLEIVQPDLQEVEACMRRSPDKHHPGLDKAIEHLLNSGGKRIRPTVTILAGRMLDVEKERFITLAASIEMLHTGTLVHDDLIDGSLLRRGTPTLNAQWSSGATVLTGDYIFARAAYLAAQTGSLPLMEIFARTLMTIVNGEITQLFDQESPDWMQSYLNRIYAKTASLFEVATEGIGLLGEFDDQMVRGLKQYGCNIGMAFQIVDDVLDFIGEEERVGKPLASDLRQGILTLPALYFLDEHPEGNGLANRLRTRALKDAELEAIIRQIRDSSAIRRALYQAEQMSAIARKQLTIFPECPEREALYELANYIVRRTS
ncbi:MAG TPA: polyprenyl synthetase family protein [Chloroflexi bacterium]|nr:polyprenyl synthetase family protein [Chloroflexota bacterium]